MALSHFDVSPPTTGFFVLNGDLHMEKVKDSLQLGSIQTAILRVGVQTDDKEVVDRASWMRFEPTIPEGATITGISITLFSFGAAEAGTLDRMEGGWLVKQDNSGRDWQLPAGVESWTIRLHAMLAEWDAGASSDTTVWFEGAPAFTNESFTIETTQFEDWTLSDGLTGINTGPGMAAQLQDYLVANQADRGIGNDPDGIPVFFHLHRKWINDTTTEQDMFASGVVQVGLRPVLNIEWDAAPTSSFEIVPQAQGAGDDMTVTINGTFLDFEDTDIGAATTWTSSIAGLLHTGTDLVEADLVVGVHTMTVVATDSAGGFDITIFDITIFDVPDDLGNAIVAATVQGEPNSSLQLAGGILSAGAGGGSGEKGVAVLSRLP